MKKHVPKYMTHKDMEELEKKNEKLWTWNWGNFATDNTLFALLENHPENSDEYKYILRSIKAFLFISHKDLDTEFKKYLEPFKTTKSLSKEQHELLREPSRVAVYGTLMALAEQYSPSSREYEKIMVALYGLAFLAVNKFEAEFDWWNQVGPKPLSKELHEQLWDLNLTCRCCPPEHKPAAGGEYRPPNRKSPPRNPDKDGQSLNKT